MLPPLAAAFTVAVAFAVAVAAVVLEIEARSSAISAARERPEEGPRYDRAAKAARR